MIEPVEENAQLDLLFVNKERLVGAVVTGAYLGHKNHEIIVLVLGEVRRSGSSSNTLNSRGQPLQETGGQHPLGGSPEG